MNLQTFVEEALVEIRMAVEGAQRKLHERGLLVGPRLGGDTHNITSKVDFDVAVEASTEDATKGGGGIKVLAGLVDVNAKAETGVKEKESYVSRVKFTIPLYLPPAVGVDSDKK